MIEKYISKLNDNCKKLESIEQFINNKTNTFSLVVPIIDSFNKIKINTTDEKILNNAITTITNIKNNNPQLKGVIDAILEIINQPILKKEQQIRR